MSNVIPFRKKEPQLDARAELKQNLVAMGFYKHVGIVPDDMVDFILYSNQMCFDAGKRASGE